MNIPLFLALVVLVGIMGMAAAWAGEAPQTAPATQPAATQPSAPLMVNEAHLPEGYPPPGPVLEVVVKHYPAARAAVVKADDVKQKSNNGMFWPLFQHIKRQKIEMSSPVDMTWSEPKAGAAAKPEAMAFLYGDPKLGQLGKDGVVDVVDLPPMTVVSISIRGEYNRANFTRGLDALNKYIENHPHEWEVTGPPRYLAYNSPFVPGFAKLGEVQLPVKMLKKQEREN